MARQVLRGLWLGFCQRIPREAHCSLPADARCVYNEGHEGKCRFVYHNSRNGVCLMDYESREAPAGHLPSSGL
jgi:hypothetical protein